MGIPTNLELSEAACAMNIPTTAPINYSNSTMFYPDNTGVLGSFTRTPDSRTQVTLDYTTIMPIGLGLNKIGYVLSYGSAPQLIISGSQIQGNANILGFVVSGGVNGLKYMLQINATLTDNITVLTHELEIVVSAPFVEDECGCPPMTMSRPLSMNLPVAPVFQQANILNGDQTRFASTFIVYWVSSVAPTVANILDKWYNTTDGLIYDRATDGNSVFWVSTAQRPSQYTTSPTPPSNPQLGDMWYDTTNNELWQWINSGAGPTWYPISATTIPVQPGPNYTANSVPPPSPNIGDYWFNTGTNQLFIWMRTGAATLWYPLTPPTPTPNPTYTYSYKVQKFTNVGNNFYSPSPGMVTCIVECIGGGGSGGTSTNFLQPPEQWAVGGGGGGSGGYSRTALTASQISAPVSVIIGSGGFPTPLSSSGPRNGGDTSFGTFCVAHGGAGGFDCDTNHQGFGGNGAPVGVGDVCFPGAGGFAGLYADLAGQDNWLTNAMGGSLTGGSIAGQNAVPAGASAGGDIGVNSVGAGAQGALINQMSTAGVVANGGQGGSGMCIVTEFCVN